MKKMQTFRIIQIWFDPLAQDYILMNDKKWFLMEHEEYRTRAAYVILSEDGAVVMNDCYNGFDEEARRNIQNFMQQQAAKEQERQKQQQVQSQMQPNQTQQPPEQQKKKPELANWQKVMDNGEYLRSAEMAEEANYNMIVFEFNMRSSEYMHLFLEYIEQLPQDTRTCTFPYGKE